MLTCAPTSRASRSPGWWSSCWWTGSSPARSSTRSRTGERALARLDPASGRSGLDEPAHRAIGRARTDLEFLSAAKLLDGLPDRLLGLQRAVSVISEEVTERLFAGSPPPQWGLKETQA